MPSDIPRQPRYLDIEWWLRKQARTLPPGTLLPSESDLAGQFRVSRMTARHAMQNLEQDGLVVRRRGAGTFTSERQLRRGEGVFLSFGEDMRRRGLTPRSELLEALVRPATTGEVEALDLAGDARVVSIKRVRFADDHPLCIERAVLPASCAAVLATDFRTGSLYSALIQIGRTPSVAASSIGARMPTAPERKWLQMTGRVEPLLTDHRSIRDQNDELLEWTELAYVASRYVIDVIFRTSDGFGRQRSDE